MNRADSPRRLVYNGSTSFELSVLPSVSQVMQTPWVRMLLLSPSFLLFWQWSGAVAEPTTRTVAKGRVFHDQNDNGVYDDGEKLFSGVRVSNGREIVTTKASGCYELPIDDDSVVFVIKPSGWRTPLSKHQLPRFYYLHKPKGSPAAKYAGVGPTGPLPDSIDFPLYSQREPKQFKALLFGDPQPRDQKELDYIAHDVIEELVGTDASFGVTLGDIMFDNLSLFESGAKAIAVLGIPWYNVIGNHDINTDSHSRQHLNESFERVFGPSYYSFDYGPVHFLVLDDIAWKYDDETGKGKYHGGLGTRQMEFIRQDLQLIPQSQLVVLLMHIPLVDVEDRQELYRLIEKRPFCMSVSGYMHHHEHRFITQKDGWRGPKPHHHVINVTVSGSWWSGAPDERGIPHTMMADGAPNGYSIISFDGAKYAIDFKAAGKPDDYQMRIVMPESLTRNTDPVPMFVNVFNGSERSAVEMRIDGGAWKKLNQTLAPDPLFVQIVAADKVNESKNWRNLPAPKNSTHLWSGKLSTDLSEGVHLLEVKAVDMNGRAQWGRRVFRVKALESTQP